MRRRSNQASAWSLLFALAFALSRFASASAEEPWPLWESYCKRFVDDQGRVIDRTGNDRSTSEGQAYAMFFALVANDRTRFDKLLNWTQANLAGGDLTLRLPAWQWGKSQQGEWKILDQNSASDADLWLAYTLIEAGRIWHQPQYEKLGGVIAARVAKEEVATIPKIGVVLLPGPHGFHPDANTWLLNPSYTPLPVLTRLAKADPKGPWAQIIGALPVVVGHENAAGFAMDWVSVTLAGVKPSPGPGQARAEKDKPVPVGSFDAIRVYLWLGLADPATPGERALLVSLPAMAAYLKSNLVPPLKVDSTARILQADGPPGFSAAVAPYLSAFGMKGQSAAQMDRLAATQKPASGLYGDGAWYFDQNLALFSTGFLSQRFRFEHDGRLKLRSK